MKKTQNLQTICNKSVIYLKNHSPTILTCLGAVGVIGTAAMAIKATPKAVQLLQQATDEKGEDLTKLETVNVALPSYIPTIIMAASTIVCILGANVLNKRQQASIASAYALLEESYRNYRGAAKSVYGDDADEKIIAEMAKKTYFRDCVYGGELCSAGDDNSEVQLFYDMYSQRYFNATLSQVINAEYHVNRNLQLRGDVPVNEFYEFLGITPIDIGFEIGWRLDTIMESGCMWLDFSNTHIKMEDGMECFAISTTFMPVSLYDD